MVSQYWKKFVGDYLERLNYDFVIHWNRFGLRFLGAWPEEDGKEKFSMHVKFVLSSFLMFYFISAPQTIDLFMFWSNMDYVVENLSTGNIPITMSLLKLVVFYRNRKELLPLILHMKEDWKKSTDKMHLAIMQEVGKTSRWINIRLIMLTETMVFSYSMLQIYLNVSGIFPNKRLYFRSYFPYNTLRTPIFEITWIFQCFGCALAAFAYTSVDSFIGITVLHVCGQLAILQDVMKHLADPVVSGDKDELQSVRQTLKFISRRHEYLNRFAGTIEDTFNFVLLIQLLSISIMLCFMGFQVFRATSSEQGATVFQIIFLLLFMSSVGGLFYVYCYVGEQLGVETTKLGSTVFECEWYNLPPREIRALMFILLQTKKPLCITAGKFCSFTIITFCEVIKRSVGYLSVLLTIRES